MSPGPTLIEEGAIEIPPPPKRRGAFRTVLKERPSAAVGAGMVIFLTLVGILAPLIAPYSPTDVGPLNAAPSLAHWLGTDSLGHDMFTLVMYGVLVSGIVGVAAGSVSMLIGGGIGILSGYFGGWFDGVSMRIADFFLVVPELILMVIVAKFLGRGLFGIILVIGLLQWAATARVIRAQVRTIRERVYVKRARAVGARHRWVLSRHVLPQVVPLLVANAVLTISLAIFDETFLSFLGLGDPSAITLGKLIEHSAESAAAINGFWWVVLPPGIAVTLLILGYSLFGQALEDSLNPRLKVSFLSPKSWRIRRLPAAEAEEDSA